MKQGKGPSQLEEVLKWLPGILRTSEKRRALCQLKGSHAQALIDFLNALLLEPDFAKSAELWLRKHTMITLRKLCENSMLYPQCYVLDGIEDISQQDGGGFCDIYWGRYSGQVVCLKVVRLFQKSETDELLKAHAREAILWSQLDHPNITPFYGLFYLQEVQQRICLASPWMGNGNIVAYLKKNPHIPRKPLIHDIASGLEYLHLANIVHGDLKGLNVLVNEFERACIADFGLSTILTNKTLGFTTSTVMVSGRTNHWASPELLEEDSHPTYESDIWAFGCVCFEVLTRLLPFQECSSDVQVIRKLLRGDLPARPSGTKVDLIDDVDDKMWELMNWCWSIEVGLRPTCEQILQEIELDDFTQHLRGVPSPKEFAKESRQFQSELNKGSGMSIDLDEIKQLLEVHSSQGELAQIGIQNGKEAWSVYGDSSSDLSESMGSLAFFSCRSPSPALVISASGSSDGHEASDLVANNQSQQQPRVDQDSNSVVPSGEQDARSRLYNLYLQILKAVPVHVYTKFTKRILGCCDLLPRNTVHVTSFVLMCNFLDIKQEDAYSALDWFHSVLDIPSPQEAINREVGFLHSSFPDFLRNPLTPDEFHIERAEAGEDIVKCSYRILSQANCSTVPSPQPSNISLSWDHEPEKTHEALLRAAYDGFRMLTLDERKFNNSFTLAKHLKVLAEVDFSKLDCYLHPDFKTLVHRARPHQKNLFEWLVNMLKTSPQELQQSKLVKHLAFRHVDKRCIRNDRTAIHFRFTKEQGRIVVRPKVYSDIEEIQIKYKGQKLDPLRKILRLYKNRSPSTQVQLWGRDPKKSCLLFEYIPGAQGSLNGGPVVVKEIFFIPYEGGLAVKKTFQIPYLNNQFSF